jgi:hypothetical protein
LVKAHSKCWWRPESTGEGKKETQAIQEASAFGRIKRSAINTFQASKVSDPVTAARLQILDQCS